MWAADDDWLDSNYIEECLKVLIEKKEVVLCSGVVKKYKNGTCIGDEYCIAFNQEKIIDRIYSYYKTPQFNCFYGLYKMKILKKVNLNDHYVQDWTFLADVMSYGFIDFVPNVYKHTSMDGNSETREKMNILYKHNVFKRRFFFYYWLYILVCHILFELKNVRLINRLWLAIRVIGLKKTWLFVDIKRLIFGKSFCSKKGYDK